MPAAVSIGVCVMVDVLVVRGIGVCSEVVTALPLAKLSLYGSALATEVSTKQTMTMLFHLAEAILPFCSSKLGLLVCVSKVTLEENSAI